MSLYLVAKIKVKYGYLNEACEILKDFVPLLEPHGWKLIAAYTPFIGEFAEIYDIWEVPDANAVPNAIAGVSTNPKWHEVFNRWREVCESENLSVCAKLPYSPA